MIMIVSHPPGPASGEVASARPGGPVGSVLVRLASIVCPWPVGPDAPWPQLWWLNTTDPSGVGSGCQPSGCDEVRVQPRMTPIDTDLVMAGAEMCLVSSHPCRSVLSVVSLVERAASGGFGVSRTCWARPSFGVRRFIAAFCGSPRQERPANRGRSARRAPPAAPKSGNELPHSKRADGGRVEGGCQPSGPACSQSALMAPIICVR